MGTEEASDTEMHSQGSLSWSEEDGTGASALGAGLVVSLEEWILECEEHKFRFLDFNYSTQIP